MSYSFNTKDVILVMMYLSTVNWEWYQNKTEDIYFYPDINSLD